MTIETIADAAQKLKKKYDETDPWKLASAMNIQVALVPMGLFEGCCKGFFLIHKRIKHITINADLPKEYQRVILAHELGHAVLHARSASGAAFTDVDMVFLKQELEKCSQKKIFLLSHYFLPERNEALSQLVSSDPRILCLFQGHTHINRVLQPPCLQGTPLVDIGGYGYQGECVEGKWIFSRFDPAWAWGYQVLQWNEESTQTYHIKPQRLYQGSNGNFFYPGAIEDKLELSSPAISY